MRSKAVAWIHPSSCSKWGCTSIRRSSPLPLSADYSMIKESGSLSKRRRWSRSKTNKVQFWLIGDLDKENPSSVRNDDLVRWIRDPDIHYHGATDNIRKFIEQSDCIVLPSYREGMPTRDHGSYGDGTPGHHHRYRRLPGNR